MTQITEPPWRIINEYCRDIESADKSIMLNILDQEAQKLQNKELSKVEKKIGNYNYFKKILTKNKNYQKALEDNFTNQKYYCAEVIIKLMPKEYKRKKQYTTFLDSSLKKLYERWNSVGSIGVTQMMLVHHPVREIKMAGLEIMIANNMGEGSADDLSYKLCQMTNCRFIVTEYVDQELHGYRQADPYCPTHGNLLYNDDSRKGLKEKWDDLVQRTK